MMNHKHRKSWISIIALVLVMALLPLSATALTEDRLESAPEATAAPQAAVVSDYLPVAGTPWNRETVSADEKEDRQFTENGFSRPWLTDLELARTRRLMEQAAAGEVTYTGPSVANASGNTFRGIGVYPLNPADYDGETFYVVLPQYGTLTDTDLLALIAAFDELGIPFDPDSLGGRNCCRNIYQDYSRYLSDEEEQRLETLQMLVRRGALTMADIPEGTLDFCIPMNRSGVVQDRYFRICPYRSMTDDELSLLALRTDSRWEDDPQVIGQMAIDAVHTYFPVPGPVTVRHMNREDNASDMSEGKYTILYTVELEIEGGYESRKDGEPLYMTVDLMKEPGHEPEIAYLDLSCYSDRIDKNLPAGTEEQWIAAAKEWAEANLKIPDGKTPQAWTVSWVQDMSMYSEEEQYWITGLLADVTAVLPDWDLSIRVWQNSCTVYEAAMWSAKWYPNYDDVPGEKDYMPSAARPGYREPVSADETTDPQMVIRHTDYPDTEDGFYMPWLTDLELARTRRLMEQMAAGEVTYTGPSAVNASGNMDGRIGVYPLNPDDYDGEKFYVLLPQYETLTDEQILSLIAAFDELGIPFDPNSLNGRNCSRNMWFRQTRALTEEEEGMLKAVKEWVREGLRTEKNIAPGTPNYYVEMDWEGNDTSFFLYPYRQLTYDEMTVLAMNEYPEGKWEDDPAEVEKLAADAASGILRKLSKLTVLDEELFDAPLDREGVISYIVYLDNEYTSRLSYQDWDIMVIEKKDPGMSPEVARIYIDYPMSYSEAYFPDRTDEELIGAAKAWAEENLQFPDGQEPEWTVDWRDESYPIRARRTASVSGRTQGWTVSIEINQQSLDVWSLTMDNDRWYPVN